MIDLFISDLHLDEQRPDCVDCLESFLAVDARRADRLFILGDLFEAWIGDDVETTLTNRVAAALKVCADSGTAIYFVAGNRDFLLGQAYAARAGMTVLTEPVQVQHGELDITLLHGDVLCTDDVEYQHFRARVRNPAWQSQFLSQSVADRIKFAREARQASEQHTDSTAAEIMDVNLDTVREYMLSHQTDFIIHGHTHRPDIHQFELNHFSATRIVLGDWYDQGSVLWLEDGAYSLQTRAFPHQHS